MKGIRRDQYGFRAYVKVGNLQREKRYPPDTLLKKMQDWRDETRVALRKIPQTPGRRDTLKADVQTYLAQAQIKQLASYKSRVCELWAWVDRYSTLARADLTRAHILETRDAWLAEGYAPKTINHRVRALRHLYRVLDGKRVPTPADDVPKLAEPKAAPVFVPVAVINRVLRKLTDPKTRARFAVLVATGQRPAQLKRAVRTDVNLRQRLWMVRPAKGGHPIPVPLTDEMVTAWRAFIAANAWGRSMAATTRARSMPRAGIAPGTAGRTTRSTRLRSRSRSPMPSGTTSRSGSATRT
jgi:integrase